MKKFWILFLLVLSLSLHGCMDSNPYQSETTEPNSQTQAQNTPTSQLTTSREQNMTEDEPTVGDYTYHSDWANTLEPYLSTDDPFYLQIMNKTTNEFGSDRYEAQNLTLLDPRITLGGKDIELDLRVAQAVYAMLAEMAHDGVTNAFITSGYRSYERQIYLYNSYIEKEMNAFSDEAFACLGWAYLEEKYDFENDPGLDLQDAERVVLSYAAPPGKSEHQTGLCVDFITINMTELTNAFENTDAFKWLSQNAYRFGFILRYQKDKTDITGYAYESWHYRYVGRDAAAKIYFGNMTLEQYRETID